MCFIFILRGPVVAESCPTPVKARVYFLLCVYIVCEECLESEGGVEGGVCCCYFLS